MILLSSSDRSAIRLAVSGAVLAIYLIVMLIKYLVNRAKDKKWEREHAAQQPRNGQPQQQYPPQQPRNGQPQQQYPPQQPYYGQPQQQYPYGVPPRQGLPATMWIVIVAAFLGTLATVIFGIALIAESIFDGYFRTEMFFIGLLSLAAGAAMLLTGIGLCKRKKAAGVAAIVILSILGVVCWVFMVAVLANASLSALILFLPLAIIGLLLWAVLANKKCLQG